MNLAAGPRAVWVSGPIGVVRLDARTGYVGRQYILPALYPLGIAVGEGAVWAASVENGYTSGTVTRIDLRTGAARTIFHREHWPAEAVTASHSDVWVVFGGSRIPRLGRFDRRGGLLGVTRLDTGANWLASDPGGAWVCCHSRRLLRIDRSGNAASSFRVPFTNPIWIAGGSLWQAGRSVLYRLDARTGQVLAALTVSAVTSVAARAGSAYALGDGTLARIDLATNHVAARRKLAGITDAVSAGPDGVWVTSVPLSASPPESVFRLNPRTLATELTVSLY